MLMDLARIWATTCVMPEMTKIPEMPEMSENDITGCLKHVQCHVTNLWSVGQKDCDITTLPKLWDSVTVFLNQHSRSWLRDIAHVLGAQ